jgi:hypothetical protein
MKCILCGHTPTTKRQAQIDAAIDVYSLSDIELRKYRAKTAPFYDVQFMIDCGATMDVALMSDVLELASHVDAAGRFTGVTRTDFYRQYNQLQSRRRQERETVRHAAAMLARKAFEWAHARVVDEYHYMDYANAA